MHYNREAYKYYCWEWSEGMPVETPSGTSTSCIIRPGTKSWQLHFSLQLPAMVYPERKQMLTQGLGSLPPIRETWAEF